MNADYLLCIKKLVTGLWSLSWCRRRSEQLLRLSNLWGVPVPLGGQGGETVGRWASPCPLGTQGWKPPHFDSQDELKSIRPQGSQCNSISNTSRVFCHVFFGGRVKCIALGLVRGNERSLVYLYVYFIYWYFMDRELEVTSSLNHASSSEVPLK